jgi:hypothetical protein
MIELSIRTKYATAIKNANRRTDTADLAELHRGYLVGKPAGSPI